MTITKLRGAEYLLRSVADGVEDYFMGAGEAPGVWHGRWADELGLTGVVEPEHLRALVEGRHPVTGVDLLAGHRERTVKAIDLTLSAPKSVSLLWAFGGDQVAAEVSIAMVEAATTALDFMERHAAVARQQQHGVRRRVGTHGLAVAMFTHRTSRDGDPQLHVHSLVPNMVQRQDGMFVAVDANPIHEWLKASGTIFQSELQRHLTDRLGVAWGPERNGCRELIGFTPEQRRAFSKRTAAIETVLEAGEEAVTAKQRMRADDRASLLTRKRKDPTLTPNRLRSRWAGEAAAARIPTQAGLQRTVCHQTAPAERPETAAVFAALVGPQHGLCATRARFGHAHVVERVAALSAGRLTVAEIEDLAGEFLRTELVVRLVPSTAPGRRKPPEWSTLEHRQLEDHVLRALAELQHRSDPGLHPDHVDAAIAHGSVGLGGDQRDAVRLLCAPGAGLRVVLAPAGHGKTALTATAAQAMTAAGRSVVALASTNKAVAELCCAGLDASTIARFRLDGTRLAVGSVVIIDEVSQVSTRDAHAVLGAVSATPGAVVWCLGDDDQGRPVQPGGLAAELRHLADHEQVAAAELTVNRRQQDPAEREALAVYRAGDVDESQTIRTTQGWEHDHDTPAATRDALAAAAVADADQLGADQVVVLAVSHVDCEDLADRIRTIRTTRGELTGPALVGPGWGPNPRRYAAGDRILFHTSLMVEGRRFTNGSSGTMAAIHGTGAVVQMDDGAALVIPVGFVRGERIDGTPNMSHGWARTIDGAQGGTWEQVHLLATPNLDRLIGYVGQSRGQRPTHTWNTTPERSGEEHGNVVLDPRQPAEQILAAVGRVPERRFAAGDDPFVLDRQLRAERDEHETAFAAAPPDHSTLHRRFTARVERGEEESRKRGASGTTSAASTVRSPRPADSARSVPTPDAPTATCSPPGTRLTRSSKQSRSSCAATAQTPTAPDPLSTSTPAGSGPTNGATPRSSASTDNSRTIGPIRCSSPSTRTIPSPTGSTDSAMPGPCSPPGQATMPTRTSPPWMSRSAATGSRGSGRLRPVRRYRLTSPSGSGRSRCRIRRGTPGVASPIRSRATSTKDSPSRPERPATGPASPTASPITARASRLITPAPLSPRLTQCSDRLSPQPPTALVAGLRLSIELPTLTPSSDSEAAL